MDRGKKIPLSRVLVQIDLGGGKTAAADDHVGKILGQLAQRREQRVSLRQVLPLLSRAVHHLLCRDDVAPVLAAGTLQEKIHLGMLGHLRQDVHVIARQIGDAEDRDPFGKSTSHRLTLGKVVGEIKLEAPAVLPFAHRYQLAPEHLLPAVSLPLFPILEHFRAEHGVLIKGVGDLSGELEALEPIAVPCQVKIERIELRAAEKTGEKPHDSPGQHLRRKMRGVGKLGEGIFKKVPDYLVSKGVVAVGPDAELCGQLHSEPALHPLALDDEDLRSER